MAQPALTITHESETQRQFVRLKLPCHADINGRRYPVKDLSSGGVALSDIGRPFKRGQIVPLTLGIPFDGFVFTIDLKAEILHIDRIQGQAGCRFADLDMQQTSLLNHIVRAYIAGDVVNSGSLLNVATRNNFSPARANGLAPAPPRGTRLKNYLLYGIAAAGALMAAYVIVDALARQAFILRSPFGMIDAPQYALAAPASGIFHNELPPEIRHVEQGALIGSIAPAASAPGPNIKIFSPCDCFIGARHAFSGQYVGEGSNLMTMTMAAQDAAITALFPSEDVHDLGIGARATMTVSGSGRKIAGVVSDIRASDKTLQSASGTYAPASTVYIIPDKPLSPDLAGRPVLIEIRRQ